MARGTIARLHQRDLGMHLNQTHQMSLMHSSMLQCRRRHKWTAPLRACSSRSRPQMARGAFARRLRACSSGNWPQMARRTTTRLQQRELAADGAPHDCAPAAAGAARRWRAARLRACGSGSCPQMARGAIARLQQRDLPADGARHDCAPASAGPARGGGGLVEARGVLQLRGRACTWVGMRIASVGKRPTGRPTAATGPPAALGCGWLRIQRHR